MTPKLPADWRQALQSQGSPLRIEDDQTHQFYVLVSDEEYRRMLGEELRQELQVAFDDVSAGAEEEWNLEAFLAKARREIGPQS
jgi:hypothetical protein